MKNEGIEIDLFARAVKTDNFSYDINLTASYNHNEFLSFSSTNYEGQDYTEEAAMSNPGNPGYLQRLQVGQSVGNYYTWAYAGVDDRGNWLVWNKDNSSRIPITTATSEDKRVTGNGLPKYNFAITNTFRYKNFDLNIFIRGACGFDLFNTHAFYFGLQAMDGNVLRRAYGQNRAITTGMNQLTDYFIEKGDYLKLDVVSLGYTHKFKNNAWVESIRVYATGRNLHTFTRFTGVDPSVYPSNGLTPGATGGFRYYPSATQLLFGVQVDF
jgi:hypothetical protein